jgi:hypothetical protein
MWFKYLWCLKIKITYEKRTSLKLQIINIHILQSYRIEFQLYHLNITYIENV